ncbi:bolA-like protein 3 [Folsomia candida]|uniref:bolA-like protein 3 n=1 Tax=Folsomia candida TaxID=158441 RepID=UPI000B8FA6F5|nr:bolA-like protein 3 [Folsomia candida]XP_021967241.1 bolA-like protein 3 [Folsomia candida]XP_021967248.1 bolA-like protein 3 [Folsomia candida]XP_035702925.1 bolA-like protein 3 [Folsomia candida]XP_035702927.1 bolA-like protein 3 [Folsomia candida]XP_035702928.1 bolA-like protein 3 [Folsomia candida]
MGLVTRSVILRRFISVHTLHKPCTQNRFLSHSLSLAPDGTGTCFQSRPRHTAATLIFCSTSRRGLANAATSGKEGEAKIKSVLQKSFPSAVNIKVEDISGGCGSMYQIFVEDKKFDGLSIVKQHQLVNTALKNEIKDMHGIRIQTQSPTV